MLEIGPGQRLVQLAYFSRDNDAIGIDSDGILQFMDWHGCVRMVRQNGFVRIAKTASRKIARIDSRRRAKCNWNSVYELCRNCAYLKWMLGRMTFSDNYFDVVYSRAGFEHLSDPLAVTSETRRVLKPGGVMFVRLSLFTSDSGSHDTRIFIDQREELPFWAHLRPEHEQKVTSNTYLNKLRLADWEKIFESEMPGCKITALCDAPDLDRQELRRLCSQGELSGYSDEELQLTVTVEATWRKLQPSEEASSTSSVPPN
jgi:SAM-dependent methyltransferase